MANGLQKCLYFYQRNSYDDGKANIGMADILNGQDDRTNYQGVLVQSQSFMILPICQRKLKEYQQIAHIGNTDMMLNL